MIVPSPSKISIAEYLKPQALMSVEVKPPSASFRSSASLNCWAFTDGFFAAMLEMNSRRKSSLPRQYNCWAPSSMTEAPGNSNPFSCKYWMRDSGVTLTPMKTAPD